MRYGVWRMAYGLGLRDGLWTIAWRVVGIMACGMADSSVKVFILNKESLLRSLNLSSQNNPFAKQDPLNSLNMPYTVLSQTGLKMQLYAD